MPDWLIFAGDAEGRRKDIIFFASHPGMDLPVVYFTMDSSLMPSCANLLAICH
jgi:hypothetical protein